MPRARRKRPALAPGYERIPGSLRHYRVVETGKEISRRQYQQLARGYMYEKTAKGRARQRARRKYLAGWADYIRRTLADWARFTTAAILKELRRLGLTPPHHGAKRAPTRAEAIRQEAFREFIGRDPASFRNIYDRSVKEAGPETG